MWNESPRSSSSSCRNPLIVWRHLRRRFGERRLRVADAPDEAQYSARPIAGRVVGTPAERVAVVVVSSSAESAPASRVASAKVWTWFPRDRPISPSDFSSVNATLPRGEKNGLQQSCKIWIRRGGAKEGEKPVVKPPCPCPHGRWHSCHPDLVNNPPFLPTSPLLYFRRRTRGLDLLRVYFRADAVHRIGEHTSMNGIV